MTGTDVFEQALTDALARHAEQAPMSDGWDAIGNRIARRRQARQIRRVGANLAVVAVLVAGGAALVVRAEGGRDDLRSATSPSTAQPAEPAPTNLTAPLPRLVVTLDGYQPVNAAEYDTAKIPMDPPQGPVRKAEPGDVRLAVVGEPAKGFDAKVVFVRTLAAALSEGFDSEEQRPSGSQAVDIAGRPGHLVRPDTPGFLSTFVRWTLASGQGVEVNGLQVSDDELLAVARAVEVGSDGSVAWPAGSLPPGLALLRTSMVGTDGELTTNVTYAKGRRVLSLDLRHGGAGQLDEVLIGHSASAVALNDVEVAGVAAVLVRFPAAAGAVLVWQVRPGVVAQMLAGTVESAAAGSTDTEPTPPAELTAELASAAASLREVSEAEWGDLLARFSPPAPADAEERAAPTG